MGNMANCSFRTKSIRPGGIYWQEGISNSFVTFRHQPTPAVISPFSPRPSTARRHSV